CSAVPSAAIRGCQSSRKARKRFAFTQCSIRSSHLRDPLSNVGRQSRSATWTRLPPPQQLKAFAMPADQRVWFHDHEDRAPIDQPRQRDERHPRRIVGAMWLHLTLHVQGELLPQNEFSADSCACDRAALATKCTRS